MTAQPSQPPATSPPTLAWRLSQAEQAPASAGNPKRSGNQHLKRALFLSAFAALHDSESRAHDRRKRDAEKKQSVATICLARRRIDVVHAMLRGGTFHQPKPVAAA